MIHLYGINNFDDCITKALAAKHEYTTDNFNRTPLLYALYRKNYQAIEAFIQNPTHQIYACMKPVELIKLMNFDPVHLPEFFTEATAIKKAYAIPNYGVIKNGKQRAIKWFDNIE